MGEEPPKILTVDDKPANLLALDAVLEPLGVPVIKAGSGDEALRHLLAHGESFAVMLLDVQMPGLDGFQTAELVRSRQSLRYLPIIFITAVNREEAHIVKGYAHDAVDYVLKPFNEDALRSKVKFFVEAHRRALALERKRELTEQRLALALDAVGFGAWSWDGASRRVVCDERCRAMLGVGHDGELDLSALGFSEPDTMAEGEKLRSERRVSDDRWVLAQGRTFVDAEGRRRIVGIVADISDEKRALLERELFLGALGHDLRNPLNAIAISASLVAHHQDPTVAALGDKIACSALRMGDLISDMLDFVRSRAGKLPIDPRNADLNTICRDVIAEVAVASEGRRTITFDAADSAAGVWDPARLGQVVQNLLTNAVRHSDPGEPVRVKVCNEGREVKLEVENVGASIPLEMQSRIFEPFVHLDARGTGLGLYVAKQLVQAHGGHIDLASGDRKTTFRVTLPTRAGEPRSHLET